MNNQNPSTEFIKKVIQQFEKGEFSEVLNTVNKTIKTYPNSSILLNIKGASLMKLKNYPESIECYKKILSLNPNSFDAFNNLGQAS